MVGLFELDQVIPYKARGKRSVAERLAALGVLISHLESLEPLALGTSARWLTLRAAHRDATRPVDLKRLRTSLMASSALTSPSCGARAQLPCGCGVTM